VGRGLACKVADVPAGIAANQLALLEADDGRGPLVIGAVGRGIWNLRQQSPINRVCGRIGDTDRLPGVLLIVAVIDLEPVVIDFTVGEVAGGRGDLPKIRKSGGSRQTEYLLVDE